MASNHNTRGAESDGIEFVDVLIMLIGYSAPVVTLYVYASSIYALLSVIPLVIGSFVGTLAGEDTAPLLEETIPDVLIALDQAPEMLLLMIISLGALYVANMRLRKYVP